MAMEKTTLHPNHTKQLSTSSPLTRECAPENATPTCRRANSPEKVICFNLHQTCMFADTTATSRELMQLSRLSSGSILYRYVWQP